MNKYETPQMEIVTITVADIMEGSLGGDENIGGGGWEDLNDEGLYDEGLYQ